MVYRFRAALDIVGINPFVEVPEHILNRIFEAAGRNSGPIPIRGSVNSNLYRQTLVRYKGLWRLYVNMVMLPASPKRIGEELEIVIEYDGEERNIPMHPALAAALHQDPHAAAVYRALPPSRQKEIRRYIATLKSEDAVARNVGRAIEFLNGRARFIGRDRP